MQPMKNVMIYKFDESFNLTKETLEAMLAGKALRECSQEETEVCGWVNAFGSGESFVEEINNSLFFRLGILQKKVSRKAVITEIEKRAREHHIDLLSRPRYKELEEVVMMDFIRNAYPEQSTIAAYIDKKNNWLVVDAQSDKKASYVTAILRRSLGSLPVSRLVPTVEMPIVMTEWLNNDSLPLKFTFMDEVELKELSKEDGGVARYKGIPLDSSKEIELNLDEGWKVTKIGLTYDETISFQLDDNFGIKRIKVLDVYQERLDSTEDQYTLEKSNGFLFSETVRQLVPDLISALYVK